MIIKRTMLSAFVAGIAVLAVGVPTASASAATVSQVIKLRTVDTSFTNLTPTSFAFTETLWQGKKQIGNDAIQCNFATPSSQTGRCSGILWFNKTGSMLISFAVDNNSNTIHGRIMGGTGAYANARGTVEHTQSTVNTSIGWATLTFTLGG